MIQFEMEKYKFHGEHHRPFERRTVLDKRTVELTSREMSTHEMSTVIPQLFSTLPLLIIAALWIYSSIKMKTP
jgi:hypothetical protein